MSVKLQDLREFVVRPALRLINKWSVASENLVLGTGLVESGYRCLDQTTLGPGPAYGFWQMEKLTHDDIWATFLPGQPSALCGALQGIAGTRMIPPPVTILHWNLLYGAAMCRIRYARVSKPLPAADDPLGMAAYWKQWYNTPLGKGTINHAIPFFKQVCES